MQGARRGTSGALPVWLLRWDKPSRAPGCAVLGLRLRHSGPACAWKPGGAGCGKLVQVRACMLRRQQSRLPEWDQLVHGCGSDAETSESSLWSLAPASPAEQHPHELTGELAKCELHGDGDAPAQQVRQACGPAFKGMPAVRELQGNAYCGALAKRPRGPSYARTLHVGPQDGDDFFDVPVKVRRPGHAIAMQSLPCQKMRTAPVGASSCLLHALVLQAPCAAHIPI